MEGPGKNTEGRRKRYVDKKWRNDGKRGVGDEDNERHDFFF